MNQRSANAFRQASPGFTEDRSPCRLPSWCLSPVAVELGSDSSTSSNGSAPRMLPHTVLMPFIWDLETSLSTSINCFRRHDRATKSIAAHSRILSRYNQGGKLATRCFSASSGENPVGHERHPGAMPCVQPDSASYHLFHTLSLLHRLGGCCRL